MLLLSQRNTLIWFEMCMTIYTFQTMSMYSQNAHEDNKEAIW